MTMIYVYTISDKVRQVFYVILSDTHPTSNSRLEHCD